MAESASRSGASFFSSKRPVALLSEFHVADTVNTKRMIGCLSSVIVLLIRLSHLVYALPIVDPKFWIHETDSLHSAHTLVFNWIRLFPRTASWKR